VSEPKRKKGLFPKKTSRICAVLLLAAIIATVAIFFPHKQEWKKIAELIEKTMGVTQKGAQAGGGEEGNTSQEAYTDSMKRALKIAQEVYADSLKRALKFAQEAHADSMKRALKVAQEAHADSLKTALKVAHEAHADSLKTALKVAHEAHADSVKRAALTAADSLKRENALKSMKNSKSAKAAESAGGETAPAMLEQPPIDCSKDTLTPMVYLDSIGGLHIGPAHVFLKTNKPCTVYWRFDSSTSWNVWNSDTMVIDCTVTLAYKAMDRCGHATEPRQEHYEIKPLGFVEGAQQLQSVNCATDTLMPWAYPDPAGGLHYGPTRICFQVNKPCTVYWRFGRDTSWQVWRSDTLLIDSATTLTYKAIDGCGHAMGQMEAYYVIRPVRKTFPCPVGMEPVEDGSKQFCIDRYEWPDRKGAIPQSYVSIFQAMDSCAVVGKRLCTSDEWSLACAGPDSFTYPYGRRYSPHACVTHDTTMRRSGSKPECRAFFGAYDMSGNLAEWTSTPAKRNARFYNVMGGFWESGPASGCFNTQYSYYPQNRHNPVGFRCCKDFVSPGK